MVWGIHRLGRGWMSVLRRRSHARTDIKTSVCRYINDAIKWRYDSRNCRGHRDGLQFRVYNMDCNDSKSDGGDLSNSDKCAACGKEFKGDVNYGEYNESKLSFICRGCYIKKYHPELVHARLWLAIFIVALVLMFSIIVITRINLGD